MPHDVFICHSTRDRAVVDAVCAALESADIHCWIAHRDVLAGADYTDSIIAAIEACRVVVLVFSKHANDSSHVKRELKAATDEDVTILPFHVDDAEPSKGMRYLLGASHWISATAPPDKEHLDLLTQSVKGHLPAQ